MGGQMGLGAPAGFANQYMQYAAQQQQQQMGMQSNNRGK